MKNANNILLDAAKKHSDDYSDEKIPFTITLTYAVQALQDIKYNPGKSRQTPPINAEQVHNLDGAKRVGTLMGRDTYSPRPKYKKRSGYIKPGTGIKKTSRCSTCGRLGHWSGDKERPENKEEKYEASNRSPRHNRGEDRHHVRFDTDENRKGRNDRLYQREEGRENNSHFQNRD